MEMDNRKAARAAGSLRDMADRAEKLNDCATTQSPLTANLMGAEATTRRFDECSIEEQIERLRQTQLEIETMLNFVSDKALEAWKLSQSHAHDGLGRVMTLVGPDYMALPHYVSGDYRRHVFNKLR